MTLRIYQLPAGPAATNAYLVVDTVTGDAMLVDTPPGVANAALHAAEESGANVLYIVITHGHWDHIVGAAEVKQQWPVPIIGHENVRPRLEDPSLSARAPIPMEAVSLDQTIDEGDELIIGGHTFTVMFMPGHDEAHIILYSEVDELIIGGDVLFPDGHGRTDLPGSDQNVLNETLKRFLDLPEQTRVLPGHGDETTIGRESHWIKRIP